MRSSILMIRNYMGIPVSSDLTESLQSVFRRRLVLVHVGVEVSCCHRRRVRHEHQLLVGRGILGFCASRLERLEADGDSQHCAVLGLQAERDRTVGA